ncbi:MAG: hypothetical protein WCF57_00035 [Pyrinomonadaceae bacterium]
MLPSEMNYLAPFIEGTITASARFRLVLIVLITASILGFAAYWNSRQESWLNSRVRLARNATKYMSRYGDLNVIKEQLSVLTKKLMKGDIAEDEIAERDELENVTQWLVSSRIYTKEQLETISRTLEMTRMQSVLLVDVPFFGVTFDVNDLGMLGGFTFVVILMWFRFTLWREYYNLSLTFKEAAKNKEHLKFCYKALAMGQVLTVPPDLFEPQPSRQPGGKVVRFLYALPVTVQLIILYNDLCSFNVGWIVSKGNTMLSISMSLVFIVLSALLTYWCVKLSIDIDKTWEETAEDIRETEQPQSSAMIP